MGFEKDFLEKLITPKNGGFTLWLLQEEYMYLHHNTLQMQ